MAEIKIKKKSPVWPWLLVVVIILAALAYYFMVYKEENVDVDSPNIGQDEQIENGTGQNMRIPERGYYFATVDTVA